MIENLGCSTLPYLIKLEHAPFQALWHEINAWCLEHIGQRGVNAEVTGYYRGNPGAPVDLGGQWFCNGSRWRFRTYEQAFAFMLRWKK